MFQNDTQVDKRFCIT